MINRVFFLAPPTFQFLALLSIAGEFVVEAKVAKKRYLGFTQCVAGMRAR